MLPRNVILFGSPVAPVEPLVVRAGPLSMLFEPETVFLRRIYFGTTEVLRGIYAAVRDRNWGTVTPRIGELQVARTADSFQLRLGVECRGGGIQFFWRGTITGRADGTVTFEFDGEARSSFLRNRVGLCVLHPLAACVGQPCWVEHPDGTAEHGTFPRYVSPHQPFRQIRAITYKPLAGLEVQVGFLGDIFETEDQRNWTDASFKTYSTPLELPFPVQIAAGTRIRQTVTILLRAETNLSLDLKIRNQGEAEDTPVFEVPALPAGALPRIGLGLARHGKPSSANAIKRLRLLQLDHLRVELELNGPDWRGNLRRAASEANALDCALHVAIFLSPRAEEAELNELAAELAVLCPPVSLWLLYHCSEPATGECWVGLAQAVLSRFGSEIPIAAGTNANFAELNRHRPARDSIALPCFSVNPQIHAFDAATAMENLEAQKHVLESAHQFSPHLAVVSPITLKPRFNAVATGQEQSPSPSELPISVDPRQMSLFAAAWTLGSIVALSGSGSVHSLTYFETTGWRGVMETEAGSPLPEAFPSIPGAVFPVFLLLASMAGFTRVAPISMGTLPGVTALALFEGERRRVVIANLTGKVQALSMRTQAARARAKVLDETNAEQAMREPEDYLSQDSTELDCRSGELKLVLKPYALAWLDLG
jgi:hypothetical protein